MTAAATVAPIAAAATPGSEAPSIYTWMAVTSTAMTARQDTSWPASVPAIHETRLAEHRAVLAKSRREDYLRAGATPFDRYRRGMPPASMG